MKYEYELMREERERVAARLARKPGPHVYRLLGLIWIVGCFAIVCVFVASMFMKAA